MPCVGELWHSTGCPLLPELLSFSLFCALFCAAPPALQKPVRGGGSGCVSAAASGRSPSCPGGSAELGNRSAGNPGLAAGSCSVLPWVLRTSCCRGRRGQAVADPPVSRRCPGSRGGRGSAVPRGSRRPAAGGHSAPCSCCWGSVPGLCSSPGSPSCPPPAASPSTSPPCRSGSCSRAPATWPRRSSTSTPGEPAGLVACLGDPGTTLGTSVLNTRDVMRHHGSFWRALSTCFPPHWHGPMLLVCGSAYVALFGDGQQLGLHLILASLCQLLLLALGLRKPSAVEMSEMSERSKQNVANGLAWSFYVGYLKIVLPRVKKSMEEFSRANPNLPACRKTWKLHILVPLSCDVYDDLEKADSNIQYVTELTETTLARAGIKKRVYKHSLYAITDEENQLWHCAVEYATPLQTLYAMSQDECAAFSREQRLEQAKLFYRTLEEILKGSKECADTYRLIAYEEPEEAETHFLSREIVWHLRQEHHEEIAVLEGSHPPSPSTTLDSAELNLQISVSDLPQPLRTDGF
ncbi:stimulator of interferon genes protein isoform X1 [Serinus canaria]|uniref:stimulator of interferon genes protein isoform X1 n=1 Tax=Serinus canaria TaxID=9135 RepID=UPI0021CCEB77|nr:stimulator of interferon genes protein isoform X1 [Serinus canaria]